MSAQVEQLIKPVFIAESINIENEDYYKHPTRNLYISKKGNVIKQSTNSDRLVRANVKRDFSQTPIVRDLEFNSKLPHVPIKDLLIETFYPHAGKTFSVIFEDGNTKNVTLDNLTVYKREPLTEDSINSLVSNLKLKMTK